MNAERLPDVIAAYLRAHDQHDTEAAVAAFTPDATVTDDGAIYTGVEQIHGWLTNAASEYTYTRRLTGAADLGDGTYVVDNHVSGNFPGGEVDLHYRFHVRNGLIDRLEIAP